ncbi:MAG: sigma-70 family RNA polymerase sigma factor [Gammaproteobacteria bacterium]|jgi:RNA polymerase sigma-70 factor (ECF subfamily)|nr:MAG: sigma-70 family RNA polymerase sigma factor [Gammaproteobacteria bacterium]
MREGAPANTGAPAEQDAQSDEALMSAYADGDASAFDVLYERHKGPVYRYFTRQLAEVEAHDCFQILWEKLIGNRDRYRPDSAFRSYLFTIAHNVLMDHFRKQGRIGSDTETEPDELAHHGGSPERQHERGELLEKLHGLIRALPNHQREAWLLRQETTFSTADIARVTGTSEEGVKSRLRYAREKLKQGMARYVG